MTGIIEYAFEGLYMVVSGGQCGVDRGALDAAKAWPLRTGGWVPKGWRTMEGADPSLAQYGCTEHSSADYPPRTELNVRESDGTLIIASRPNSPGTALTQRLCEKHKRPYMVVKLPYANEQSVVDDIVEWVMRNAVGCLNVAGNRDWVDSDGPTLHYDATTILLSSTFMELESRGRIITK